MLKAYVFPGQGSQVKGMGRALFEQFPDYVARADGILGYSLRTLCLEDADLRLAQTAFTQPALYVVSALGFLARQRAGEKRPDFLAGHSLGEYTALFAAGAFDFETGLRLVKRRGELMSQARGGGMAAVLRCDMKTVLRLLRDHELDDLDIANFNSPQQIVISGPTQEIARAQAAVEQEGGVMIPLNVSAAFHSRYMRQAADEFAAYLSGFRFSPLRIPVIANVDALPYRDNAIAENLTQQIRRPVQWTNTVRYMLERGVSSFEELGPGEVLTRLIRAIESERIHH